MKKAIIVALVCLNAALAAALLLGTVLPTAKAQVMGGGNDYVVLTGKVQSDLDALYVLDLASRRFKVWKFDKTKQRLLPIALVDLKRDFGRAPAAAQP